MDRQQAYAGILNKNMPSRASRGAFWRFAKKNGFIAFPGKPSVETLYYIDHIAALFAISLIVGSIAGPLLIRLLAFFAGKTKSTLDDRVLAAIKVPLETFFFIFVFYATMHYFPELSEAAAFFKKYIFAIMVLVATFMLSEASGAAIRWYYEEGHQEAKHLKVDLSLLPLVRKVTKLAIYGAGIVVALSTTGFDVTGILAVTSVLGLILGLASQETLGNIFAGIALQIDRPYHYGDYLKLPSGEIAKLDKIGMRTTRMTDMMHNTIIISNSEFAKLRVTNLSLPDDVSIVPVQAELPGNADLPALKKRLDGALLRAKPKGLMFGLGRTMAIDSVRPSSVIFTYSFWVKGYANAGEIKEIANREIHAFSKMKGRL